VDKLLTSKSEVQYTDLHILDKRQQLVPLRLNRVQSHLLENLTGRDLVLKARQMGISTAIQAWLFKTATSQTARAVTLTHKDDSTTFLRLMSRMFYDNLPEGKRPQRSTANATMTTYPATNSTMYTGTAGSPESGRAGSFSHMHGSEVAFWQNGEKLLAGVMQAIPLGFGHIVLESTANGQQGWFYNRCMEALDGSTDWKLHFYAWWWDNEYRIIDTKPFPLTDEEQLLTSKHNLDYEQIAWRRIKQKELGQLFQQEYPEDPLLAFIASGAGYFNMGLINFTANISPSPYVPHDYVAGLDFGQANDYTVCTVINTSTLEQVDMLRVNRESWASMRQRIADICGKWRVRLLVAEENSMQTNIEALRAEFVTAKLPTIIRPFTTTHASKTAMLATLRLALEERGLKLQNHATQKAELQAFTSRQTATGAWILSAPDGLHDDTVMALALAWYGVSNGGASIEYGTLPSVMEL
jgi:hypothetical protein